MGVDASAMFGTGVAVAVTTSAFALAVGSTVGASPTEGARQPMMTMATKMATKGTGRDFMAIFLL